MNSGIVDTNLDLMFCPVKFLRECDCFAIISNSSTRACFKVFADLYMLLCKPLTFQISACVYELVVILFVKSCCNFTICCVFSQCTRSNVEKNVCMTGLGVPGKILFPVRSRKAEI